MQVSAQLASAIFLNRRYIPNGSLKMKCNEKLKRGTITMTEKSMYAKAIQTAVVAPQLKSV